MKKTAKKIIILFGIFILALAGYFLLSMKRGKNDVTYTSVEDAGLPVVYMEMFGEEMNCLYGYQEDNRQSAGRGNLTVLPDDRNLTVSFRDVDSKVQGIQYEIRSLDGERLVERTVLEQWTQEDGVVRAELPIQNLLTKEEEYTMTVAIATDRHPAIYYYTRIVWTDNNYVQDMIHLAEDFSSKSMDYEAAKELTTYLETDANADNSSLGHVTLKNSFSQLTWRGLPLERTGEISVELQELQGIMGMIQISYVAACTDDTGKKDYFDVTESYTMKWNSQRIYMMDFDRRMNQIFSGDDSLYSGKRIMLGISDEEDLQVVGDTAGKYKAFVANRALWCYDTERSSSTKIFAFRKSEDDLRLNDDSHGIKILAVSDEGAVDFLVYGYMNRGNHEGSTGVSLYRYESDGNSLTERLYLPATEDYWSLRQDIGQLSYLNSSQIFYLLMDHAVYGIDLSSREYTVVAEGLTEENFSVSDDGSRIAWQEGSDIYASEKLHVMDLRDGKKDEVSFSSGTVIRLIGFVGRDLVYGLADAGEQISTNGRVVGLPLTALQIVGDAMETETRYEKDGVYITDVEIRDSRIHLMKMAKTESGYLKTEEDTLVCNEAVAQEALHGIGYIAGEKRGRQYFVQLDFEVDKEQNLRLHVPKKMVAEEDNVVLLKPNETVKHRTYYAYSGGRMQGAYVNFRKAVLAAFDGMGLVADQNGRVFWVRANRSDTKTIRDIQTYVPRIRKYLEEFGEGSSISTDGTEIIDARGCTLSQVLYFVYRGMPIAAYYKNGDYGLIYGYDQYNITCLWYPGTEQEYTEKIGLNDAAEYFSSHGENDFLCFLPAK